MAASASGREVLQMKEKKLIGITMSEVLDVLAEKLKAGSKLGSVVKLTECATPKKDLKAKRKLLKADKKWTVGKDVAQYKNGLTIPCFASWDRRVVVHYNGQTFIGWTLFVDCGGRRIIYYVPIRYVEKLSTLDGIDLNEKQRSVLVRMANSLGRPFYQKSWEMTLDHPVLVDLWENLEHWQETPLKQDALVDLLRRESWLWHIFLTEIPVHILPFVDDHDAVPVFAENLVTDGREDQDVLMQALRAVTFVNAFGLADAGPIWCGRSLKVLESAPERAVLIRGTAAVQRDVVAALEERDRIMKSGSSVPAPTTVPVLLSRSLVFSDLVVNHIIPPGRMRLSDEEQDLLRTAMAHLLKKDWAGWVIKEMDRLSSVPEGYRCPRTSVWRSVLLCGMALSWFPNHWQEVAREAETLWRNENQRLDQERREIEAAVELLTNPDRYADCLISIPNSKHEAEEALEKCAGFVWTPTKGKILEQSQGKPLVVFRKNTICRLLGWPGEDSRRLETLLTICEQRGVLLNRGQKVTFKDGSQLTMLAFIFSEDGV